MAGGSGYFAAQTAADLGCQATLVTNLGATASDANSMLAALDALPGLRLAAIRRGHANRFLSLWEAQSGRKQLYCEIGADIGPADAIGQLDCDAAAVVIFGTPDAQGLIQLMSAGVPPDAVVGLAPNQTLLQQPHQVAKLLQLVDWLFLNAAEAVALTAEPSLYRAVRSLRQRVVAVGRAKLCVTRGKEGMSLIHADGRVSQIRTAETLSAVQAGGDSVALATIVHAAQGLTAERACESAVRVTASAMRARTPFGGVLNTSQEVGDKQTGV
jgi:sugar/nucleoside kinase (ribokinase family)